MGRRCDALRCNTRRTYIVTVLSNAFHGECSRTHAAFTQAQELVRADKPIAYLDIDDTGLAEAGYGPQA